MFKIDYSILPPEATEVAFDNLQAEFDTDTIKLNYDTQEIFIDTGNEAFATSVHQTSKRETQKEIRNYRADTGDDSYRFGMQKLNNYLLTIKNDISLQTEN